MTEPKDLAQNIREQVENAIERVSLEARIEELEKFCAEKRQAELRAKLAELDIPPEVRAQIEDDGPMPIEPEVITTGTKRNTEQPDYSMLPEHLRPGVKRWIEHGIRPGSFLQAVMRRDLEAVVTHADDVSLAHLREIVQFFQHEAPRQCWGSEEWIQAWELALKEGS